MKTSVNWLKHYVDIPWDARELATRLTMAGLEVEGIDAPQAVPPGVVVAEILSRDPHPNADKLSVCRVSTGSGDPLQIVCGAPNCDAGSRVPLATVGTEFAEGFKIKKAKLRGVESMGMLCSARELGLSDNHDGLLLLAADAPLGKPLADLIGTDAVIDWEVTPNRPDWLCHIGIAREIAAVSGKATGLRLPDVALRPVPGTRALDVATVGVSAPDLCPRYTARLLRNVTIGPSPDWLQKALTAVGLRPINNVVDITNYVMLECGQPLHAFDFERLAGRQIIVRRASPGESLVTLDGRKHELTPDNLLIADAERGVALAGIMGGENSMIDERTRWVLLESAQFTPSNIRATSRKLGLSTDSSHRFERGVSWDMVEFASARATALICELADGELLDGFLDVAVPKPAARRITCRCSRVNQLLGLSLSPAEVAACLDRLGIAVAPPTGDVLEAVCPPHRLDLEREADLIEEVMRMHGLERIPEASPTAQLGGPRSADAHYPVELARSQLLALGLDEVLNYSLLPEAAAVQATQTTAEELVRLSNPISAEGACLRPSLLPSMLQTVAINIAHNNPDLAVFEIGRVMVHAAGKPEERWQAAILLTGRRHPERYGTERSALYDFDDLKGLLESWLAARGFAEVACLPATHPALVPGRAADMRVQDRVVAVFGEVIPELTRGMRFKTPLFAAVIELASLWACTPPVRRYRPLPQFPSTTRDISLVADARLSAQEIGDVIRQTKCPWLETVEIFDIFTDEKTIGAGKRSMAFSLTFRNAERTLNDDEVNRTHDQIKGLLASRLGVQFR